MTRIFYPAIFTPEADGGYSVVVPDIEGCITEGDTLEEAHDMAFDAVGLNLVELAKSNNSLPSPSKPDNLPVKKGDFVVLVEFDMVAYQKKHDTKAIKKTLTIPSWLNSMAESQHINFSSVLQSALKEKLNLSERQ